MDDTEETLTYDGLGRMKTATKVENSTTTVSVTEYRYNDIGLVTDSNETLFNFGKKTIDYAYDQAGLPTSITYPNGTTYSITSDYAARIDSISAGGTKIVTYKYIGSKTAQRKYPVPNVTYQPSYDNLGRITSADSGSSIAKFNYEYGANTNNISKITYDHRTTPVTDPYNTFDYDKLDRLTGVDYFDSTDEEFTMDDLGNRDYVNLRSGSDDYVIDAGNNRYVSIDGNSLGYDAAGNMTKDKNGYKYYYDEENRITAILTSQNSPVAYYAYDALSRRIRKIDSVAGATTVYYNNKDWQVLSEYDGSNAFKARYVYGNYIDEVLMMNDGSSNDYYYAHDHLRSPVALLSSSGSVLERYEYDAYGYCHVLGPTYTPDGDNKSNYGNTVAFTGRTLDILDNGNLGLMYYRGRYYSPQMGRFLTNDPEEYIDSMNLYQYCVNNPIMRVDPFGLACKCTSIDPGLGFGKSVRNWELKPRKVAVIGPVPIYLSGSVSWSVNGTGEVCQYCCSGGKLGYTESVSAKIKLNASIASTAGVEKKGKNYHVWAGLRLEGSIEFASLSVERKIIECPGVKNEKEWRVCGQGSGSVSISGGASANAVIGRIWKLSASGYATGKVQARCKGCVVKNSEGWGFDGDCEGSGLKITATACWGPCFTWDIYP